MPSQIRKRTTIRDVASFVGVTPSTVSRVLNNKPDVSPETRERVLNAIARLNFHPNAQAISLSVQRTRVVGLVVQNITHVFCTAIMESVHTILRENGHWLLVTTVKLDTEEHAQQQPMLIEKLWRSQRVDGLLILTPVDSSMEVLNEIARDKFPCVLIDSELDIKSLHTVKIDNIQGGYLATSHLLKLGYREIGHLAGPRWVPSGRERMVGYEKALQEWDISVNPNWVIPGQEFDEQTGILGMEKLLSLSTRPRAIFAACDYIAMGALKVIYSANLRVPEDIAIVGFDDIPLARSSNPPLTTVRQPLDEIGRTAAEQLCRLISQSNDLSATQEPMETIIKTDLIVRESCGRNHITHLTSQNVISGSI